jgi:outer membrane protein TolC
LTVLLAAGPVFSQEVLELRLADALERARGSSPRLAELAAAQLAAEADEREAGAARRPEVQVSGGYTRLSDVPELSLPQPDGTVRTIFPNIPDNFSARAAVTVAVYTGGRLGSAEEAAASRRAAAEHDVAAGEIDLDLTVTLTYWDLVVAGEHRRVLERAIAAFDAHLEDARNRRRFGLAAANEVLAVEVERDRSRLRQLEAERIRATAEARLELLLDFPPDAVIVPTEELDRPDETSEALADLIVRALESRPERAALLARVAAADAAVELERGAGKPQVRASAGYDLAQPNRRILPPEDELDDSWDVSVAVVYILFDGGRRHAAVARADARAEAARQRLEELERAIRLEVTSRHLEIGTARAGIEVAEKAVLSAAENVRVTKDRYREGLVPSSELLDAETALLSAALEATAARVDLRRAVAGLERAIGAPPGPGAR